MTKLKILNFLVIISSLLPYLEWAGGNSGFLFQLEAEVIRKLFTSPLDAIHPFTLIPLLGQVMLCTTLLGSKVSKKTTYAAIAFLALLILLISFIGLMNENIKVLISTFPFIAFSIWSVLAHKKYDTACMNN
ncbi:MAG: hypothetical protein HKN68_06615 [Saprospiraceae bacterium]|nr:hypothetical protein [Saprospiraceae bacterium]